MLERWLGRLRVVDVEGRHRWGDFSVVGMGCTIVGSWASVYIPCTLVSSGGAGEPLMSSLECSQHSRLIRKFPLLSSPFVSRSMEDRSLGLISSHRRCYKPQPYGSLAFFIAVLAFFTCNIFTWNIRYG